MPYKSPVAHRTPRNAGVSAGSANLENTANGYDTQVGAPTSLSGGRTAQTPGKPALAAGGTFQEALPLTQPNSPFASLSAPIGRNYDSTPPFQTDKAGKGF